MQIIPPMLSPDRQEKMSTSPLLGPLQTQLPPSPELKSGLTSSQPQEFSLDGTSSFSRPAVRRLRSVARYQSFFPQVLACSSALAAYEDRGGTVANGGRNTSLSCLGAVAGSQGVALFRLSKPHVPLLILSHATNTSSTNSISSLAFEPKQSATDSLYLAATRGSGVLIWDASGHSPNPLVGRVSMDQTAVGGLDDSRLTSMAWKTSSTSSILATVTASSLCVWDLRTPSKPSTKFGPTRRAGTSSFVQVACSSQEEVATIDLAGIIRIYDVRMNTARNQSSVSSFAAHETAGVGITSFGRSRWLSWGLDAPMTSAIIKVWTKREVPVMPTEDLQPKTVLSTMDYSLAAQCVRPNLACARVCLSPVEDKFMAIGHLPTYESSGSNAEKVEGWWAELYKLQVESEDTFHVDERFSIRTFGVEKEAGFHGGEATSSDDKTILVSALGSRTKLGSLQAAEVSLASAGESSNECDVEMILCCLSDSGVVSTHSISEALPKTTNPEGAGTETPTNAPNVKGKPLRTAFSLNNHARIYPEDREGTSLVDAASFWGMSRTGTEATGLKRPEERRLTLDESASSPQVVENANLPNPLSRRTEGGFMPFDMDVPVSYGAVTTGGVANLQIGITDMSTGALVSGTSTGGMTEGGGPVSSDPSKKPSTMETIDTERVPCPRLCGAVFGRGNGGLVIFHNGEVKKMWSWYQRTDNVKVPQLPAGLISSEHESIRQGHTSTPSGLTKQGPRTLKELLSMVSAAKDAQWGEEVASDGSDSNDILSGGGNFYEDDSLGSNSSDDEDDEDGLGNATTEDMYRRNFGGQDQLKGEGARIGQSPLQAYPLVPSPSSASRRTNQLQLFAGPSSDMLCPVVRLTRKFDKDMLGNQSVALAEGWELGPWDTKLNLASSDVPLPFHGEETKSEVVLDDVDPVLGSSQFPYLLNAAPNMTFGDSPSITRTKSDSNLGKKVHHGYSSNATLSARTGDSVRRMMKESGLYGGEGGVRPNMEEPMKFFKKLFNQPQEGGPAGFSTMLSPPDRPYNHFFANTPQDHSRITSQGSLQSLFGNSRQLEEGMSDGLRHATKVGVYTLTVRLPNTTLDDWRRGNLGEIRDRCLHNASVCAKTGNTEKEGVWKLLAQTVERQIDEMDGKQTFSGWGGNGGGALGVELVGNFLKYYEARGDCQMLATMACVLSGGRRSSLRRDICMTSDEYRPYLLPLDQDEKYDSYIRKYADLLYEWGLLTLRSELNKHLVRVPVERIYSEVWVPSSTSEKQMTGAGEITSLEDRQPGVAVVFQCSRCGNHTEFNSNVCRQCRDFAFRCSICDNAVKGLFTVCDVCNHGGHVGHMTLWFSKHVECPTGCGCNCALSPLLSGATEASTPMGAENDPVM